ncbi:DNA-binding transcriptional regulator DhaR [Nocardia africana]|uniref:DNA-binding transcriptional regulator DhaR n=2 Tax=Nocardia africana TaxID=134964 RepID=A0A378WP21_9NOCA|nr:DNA-binding transcriptional regulator DhaR [Nocardia africana]
MCGPAPGAAGTHGADRAATGEMRMRSGHDSALLRRRAALERQWARWVPSPRDLPAVRSLESGPTASDAADADVPEGDTAQPRADVAQSWVRSRAFVDPATDCAPAVAGDVASTWADSPLRGPIAELSDQLHSITHDAGFVAAVTDEAGTILWSDGGQVMRRRAERVGFAPGGRWDENHMGTNALSLALHTGRPSSVFSAEHLVAALHGWVCYCAPIRSADGHQLGVLDLSTTWDRSHPLAMSTVLSLTAAVEAKLQGGVGNTASGVRLECLGGAALTRGGRPLRLRRRLLEILTLLALEPDGYTPERLQLAVYGDRPTGSSTLKADVSHLRRATGGDISNRVYRLTTPVSCDATEMLAALAAGDTATAVRLYRGPLLPGSQTPGVVEWREYLEVGIRTAVLSAGEAEYALDYGAKAPGDIEVHEHALRLLPARDARRAVAAARLHSALRS